MNRSQSILIAASNNTVSLVRSLNSMKEQTIANDLTVIISDACSPKQLILKTIKTSKSLKSPVEFLYKIKLRFHTTKILLEKSFISELTKSN